MIKLFNSVLCLILLNMTMTAFAMSYIPAKFCNIICEHDGNTPVINLNSMCNPIALDSNNMSSLNKSTYHLCSLEPIYNLHSPVIMSLLSYNNCGPWTWYIIGLTNPYTKCQLRLEDLERPHRQKQGNVPVKDQKQKTGQVISNSAESIKNKLKSTVNMDEKMMKDKHTMSGPEKGKM